MTGIAWLVMTYRLPAKPVALRATVRRKLTAGGAVYLANAVAALPASSAAERLLRGLRKPITDHGGSAVILRGTALEGSQKLADTFNKMRDSEYDEIIARCQDISAGVTAASAAGTSGYDRLFAAENLLHQLVGRHSVVHRRDILGASQAGLSESALAATRAALDRYAKRVYEADQCGP